MQSNVILSMCRGALLTASVLTVIPAIAADKTAATSHSPAKMTCEQFVALEDVVKPKMVYWAEGFNKKGKAVDSVVDVDETDKLVPVLVTECIKTPKTKLVNKIKEQSSAAKKPAIETSKAVTKAKDLSKMTCEEFVALDDVVKPKVVYWAEGFNKKGKAVDAVVDVDETDKLVPVLVTECKATPKLTLWQKIKKHL